MQGMAELVEQRACIVEAEERRVSFREVHHIDDDRPNIAGKPLLGPEGAHPGAAALRRPREVVADEDADEIAVRVADLPEPDVRMIAGNVLQLREAQAEQAVGRLERGLDHPLELEIRLDLRLVDVVALAAHLLGVVAPVPGFDHDVVPSCSGEGLEGRRALRRHEPPRAPRPDAAAKPRARATSPSCLRLERREGLVPEQSCTLRPQAHHLGDDGLVVGRPARIASADPRLEGLLASGRAGSRR